ncbi:MAG: hypothetical protein ACRDBO_13685 [Lachnospiraceae bacterium]
MSKNKRIVRNDIMVSHEKLDAIKERMEELGCCNRGAFLRKMTIDEADKYELFFLKGQDNFWWHS